MKINKSTVSVLLATTIMVACGGGDSVESKKEKLKGLKSESIELNKEIKALTLDLDSLEGGTPKKTYTPVNVTNIATSSFSHYVKVQGVVDASKDVVVRPEVMGVVQSIKAKEGQRISKGQTIAIINADAQKKQLRELEVNLELVNDLFNKQQTLWDKKIGTEVAYLQAKSQKESLESKIATVKENLSKFVITTPISGYVDNISVKVGEMASPSAQAGLARVVNSDEVQIKADVSEALLGKVKVGDKVSVSFGSIGFETTGRIVQTGQFIDPQNRTFKLLVDLDKNHSLLKPNLLAVIKLADYKVSNVISIPASTVQEDLKGSYVYLLNKNKTVKKQYITTGKFSDDALEVTTGLKVGDILVTVGQRNVASGEKVTVVK